MIADYYYSHYGADYYSHYDTEFMKCDSGDAATNVVSKLVDNLKKGEAKGDPYHSPTVHLTELSEDAFSLAHELSHLLSLLIIRPTVSEFKIIWSRIEELLQQAAAGSGAYFWDKFSDLNWKLYHCLSNSLALEEVRANIITFSFPGMQEKFMNEVYKKGIERKDSEIFYALHSLTGGVACFGIYLMMLAECCDPANPLKALAGLQQMFKEERAETWSEEEWWSWFISWKRLDEWEAVTTDLGEKRKSSFFNKFMPSAWLISAPNGVVNISCIETMKLSLFLESMRQQLSQLILHPKLIFSLNCPFNEQPSSCCGFGNFLRNIWAAVPDEERGRLKLPSKICLQSVSIDPL